MSYECTTYILSSYGRVSSSCTCLDVLDHRTKSGLRVEIVISSGNLSYLLWSTLISQSAAHARIPEPLALTKLISRVAEMLRAFLLSSFVPKTCLEHHPWPPPLAFHGYSLCFLIFFLHQADIHVQSINTHHPLHTSTCLCEQSCCPYLSFSAWLTS